jgi:sirohydrochlorin cobaltochelatase
MKLKRLEAQRRQAGTLPSAEELELEQHLRRWPRTPENDPYQAGLEALAAHWRGRLKDVYFALAYNEFCAPTLEEAVDEVVGAGASQVTIVPTMFTPGGSHSEIEIPAAIEALTARHPHVRLRYAWPFDLDLIAGMLTEHLQRFDGR